MAIQIDLTDEEQNLLVQTVEESSYSGRLAHLVASVLDKLRKPKEPKE